MAVEYFFKTLYSHTDNDIRIPSGSFSFSIVNNTSSNVIIRLNENEKKKSNRGVQSDEFGIILPGDAFNAPRITGRWEEIEIEGDDIKGGESVIIKAFY